MKLFEIIQSFWPVGGGPSFVCAFCCELLKNHKDIDLRIVSLYDCQNTPLTGDLESKGAKIYYLGKKRGLDIKCGRRLRKIIEEERPDICHLHLATYTTMWLSGKSHTQTNFYTFHTVSTKESIRRKTSLTNVNLRMMVKNGSLLPIGISPLVGRTTSEYFGIGNIDVINNGVDIEKYDCSKPLSERSYDFVSAGRMVELKNNLMMLECFGELQKKYPDLTYLVLGDGPEKDKCEKFVKDNHIKNVAFKGYVSNVNEYLSQSKCLLIGSKFEGNPITINEAIASGTWIVATKVGGIPDVVNDTNGYLTTPDSKEDFLKHMELFVEQTQSIEKTIDSNISSNRGKVSIEKCVNDYLKIFREHLKQ